MIYVLIVVMAFVAAIFGGAALSDLWGKFAVPLGIPEITIFHALGLSTICGLFLSGLALVATNILEVHDKKNGITIAQRLLINSLTFPIIYGILWVAGYLWWLLMQIFPNF